MAIRPCPPTRHRTGACASRCGSRRRSSQTTRPARRSTSTSAQPALIVAATAAVAFILALVAYALWPEGESRPIAWQDLRAGRLTITGETKRVFRDDRALRRYLTGAGGRVPTVDFVRNQVLLVSPGPRSSTGHALLVESVSERSGTVTVTVRERTPAVGDRVEPRVTFPYRLLSLPAGKDVYVNWPGRSPG